MGYLIIEINTFDASIYFQFVFAIFYTFHYTYYIAHSVFIKISFCYCQSKVKNEQYSSYAFTLRENFCVSLHEKSDMLCEIIGLCNKSICIEKLKV